MPGGLASEGKEVNYMLKYETPEMEVVMFSEQDVITTSNYEFPEEPLD